MSQQGASSKSVPLSDGPKLTMNNTTTTTATQQAIIMSNTSRSSSSSRSGRCGGSDRGNGRAALIALLSWTLAALMLPGTTWLWLCPPPAMAVSVQRLTVPDLVVVDQVGGQASQPIQLARSTADPLGGGGGGKTAQSIYLPSNNLTQHPEAASLINSQDLMGFGATTNGGNHHDQQQQLTFECLISYDRKRDKNLIIKWHHDDRVEPIYQWIVELDKISIAPQYKPYILANNSSSFLSQRHQELQQQQLSRASAGNSTLNSNNQVQLLEASFRLIRPSKELGGKYTCSAISVQNDDSKWRKMIVFTPPRSFKFNATRTDFGQSQSVADRPSPRARQTVVSSPMQLTATNQAELLHQHQSAAAAAAPAGPNELPLAYRSRGFDGQPASTISPQMYKTIDYVNVNPNYRPPPASPMPLSSRPPLDATGSGNTNLWQQQQQQRRLMASNGAFANGGSGGGGGKYSGVKLVCDIDQIFPVPEVSIYRLAIGTNGSHPMDKLTKSETRIEKNPLNGLYHIQVISVLLDDEIELKYGPNEPVYFECLIGLTNLELSKYSDNKRSLVYRRPSVLLASSSSQQQGIQIDQNNNNNMADVEMNGANLERSSSESGALRPRAAVYVLPSLLLLSLMILSSSCRLESSWLHTNGHNF